MGRGSRFTSGVSYYGDGSRVDGGGNSSGDRDTGASSNDLLMKPSKPINVYQQMAQAAQAADINNLSGTNTTKPDHYGDGTDHGNNNPNGTGGLPNKPDNKPVRGDRNDRPPADAKPDKPEEPKPLSAQDQYAQIVEDDYKWWQENYLPLYYEALHAERGGNFDKDLNRADMTTGAAFEGAKGDVQRAARGFGVDADIDEVKWSALEASQKSGNRAALAPRVTQEQLSNARKVNQYGGPTSDKGQKIMMNKPIDKMMPLKDQWLEEGRKGYGVPTR